MFERHAAQRDDPPFREVQGRSAPTALLTTVSFLLAVAFFGEVLGYFSRAFNTFLGAVFLVLFLQRQLPWGVIGKPQKKWLGLLLLAFSLIGVFHWTGWVRVLLLSLLVGGIGLLRGERGKGDVRVYQLTALFYGLFLWFWQETATGC